MVDAKIAELNVHDGTTGINQQTANKLPEGDSKKYATGESKAKSQGKVLK